MVRRPRQPAEDPRGDVVIRVFTDAIKDAVGGGQVDERAARREVIHAAQRRPGGIRGNADAREGLSVGDAVVAPDKHVATDGEQRAEAGVEAVSGRERRLQLRAIPGHQSRRDDAVRRALGRLDEQPAFMHGHRPGHERSAGGPGAVGEGAGPRHEVEGPSHAVPCADDETGTIGSHGLHGDAAGQAHPGRAVPAFHVAEVIRPRGGERDAVGPRRAVGDRIGKAPTQANDLRAVPGEDMGHAVAAGRREVAPHVQQSVAHDKRVHRAVDLQDVGPGVAVPAIGAGIQVAVIAGQAGDRNARQAAAEGFPRRAGPARDPVEHHRPGAVEIAAGHDLSFVFRQRQHPVVQPGAQRRPGRHHASGRRQARHVARGDLAHPRDGPADDHLARARQDRRHRALHAGGVVAGHPIAVARKGGEDRGGQDRRDETKARQHGGDHADQGRTQARAGDVRHGGGSHGMSDGIRIPVSIPHRRPPSQPTRPRRMPTAGVGNSIDSRRAQQGVSGDGLARVMTCRRQRPEWRKIHA